MTLPIAVLGLEFQDAGLLDLERVQEMVDALKAGEVLPPVVVYFDGADYRLYDGFHRIEAWRRTGRTDVEVELRHGTRADMDATWRKDFLEWRERFRDTFSDTEPH